MPIVTMTTTIRNHQPSASYVQPLHAPQSSSTATAHTLLYVNINSNSNTATPSIGNKGDTATATTAREREGGQRHRTCNVSFFFLLHLPTQDTRSIGKRKGKIVHRTSTRFSHSFWGWRVIYFNWSTKISYICLFCCDKKGSYYGNCERFLV
mmetsp:Transcript_30282/g.34388  ORF Transcript_30282/g.34388 Transcript_30282/m.34388 type:complete len:152 (+) Transcript_30282:586-1041(+)